MKNLGTKPFENVNNRFVPFFYFIHPQAGLTFFFRAIEQNVKKQLCGSFGIVWFVRLQNVFNECECHGSEYGDEKVDRTGFFNCSIFVISVSEASCLDRFFK